MASRPLSPPLSRAPSALASPRFGASTMATIVGTPRLKFERGLRTAGMDADPVDVPICSYNQDKAAIQTMVAEPLRNESIREDDVIKPEPVREDQIKLDPGEPSMTSVAPVDITTYQVCIVILGNLIPNVLLVVLFSDMGLALECFIAVAPTHMSLAGDGLISASAILLASFYVLSLRSWPRWAQALGCLFFYVLFCAGVFLKARNYPWGPLLLLILHIPGCLGVLRATLCKNTKRGAFYSVTAVCAAACALGVMLAWCLWIIEGGHYWNQSTKDALIAESAELYKYVYKKRELVYEVDCGKDSDLSAYSNTEKTKIRKGCASANTIWFLAWASPLIAIICDTVIALFCLMQACMIDFGDMSRLERSLEHFLLMLTLMLVGIYSSASVSGASLRLGSALAAFFAAGLGILMVWAYQEIGRKVLERRIKESPLSKLMMSFWASDWARAVLVGGMNVAIPCFFALNYLKQRFIQCTRRSANGSASRFTPMATRLIETMSTWNWAGILSKVNIFGELFFVFQVGVAKVTYIFLSWMNQELGSLDFVVVVLMVAVVGYTMFLLPPVPGVPVYVFSGIVVAERARKIDSLGFHAGCWIAAAVGLVLKLCACVGQYMIGFWLGKSVKIQQLIGVDKVPTRAIEMILKRPGLNIGKVAILVGGPDWPTSVTCGILKLNVCQMLLGTCPVLFVLAPCVLAGAFMGRVTGGEDSIWNTLASTSIGASFLIQMGSMCTAMYYITNVIQNHGEDLAKPRPEHEAVAALTASEARYREVYGKVSAWGSLSMCQRLLILAATILMLLSCFVFLALKPLCFRSFNVSSRISDSYDVDGLEGNAFNIVMPVGWVALGMFFFACSLHIIFIKVMERNARKKLAQGEV